MKKGWQTKKVSEIAKHSLGKMLDKAKNKGEPKPYLRNLNVRWFDFDLSDVQEMRFVPEDALKYTAVKGDVLICEGGYPGRAAIWEQDEPIYFQKALHRVRFHEPDRSKWFLYYLLSKDLDGSLKNHFNGAGIQHFTGEALAKFEVPVPPLAEQQRIVGLLDEAFEGVAKVREITERNLQNARDWGAMQAENVLSAASSGCPSNVLEALVAPGCTLSYGIVQPGEDVPHGLPVVRPIDLSTRTVSLSGLKRIDPALARGYARTTLEGGDLLLCVRGTTGTVSVAEAELAGANVTRGIVPVRFEPRKIASRFGYYLLRSRAVQAQIRAKTYGTALMQINIGDLRQIVVSVPPMDRQIGITEQLESIDELTDRLVGNYTRKLAALDELKKSLLNQAFSGQLRAAPADKLTSEVV